MPFDPSLYTSIVCNPLVKTEWKDTVYKFDSSSFYNWEQDNLPIDDLEARTDFLYLHMGKPLDSSIGLIVSSTIPLNQPSGIVYYPTLQSAIAALPKMIHAPVLIEVAASGDLGSIEISNFQFGGNGSIEIVNRGFAKIFQTSSEGDGVYLPFTITGGTAGTSISQFTSQDLLTSIDANATNCDGGFIGRGLWGAANRTVIVEPELVRTSTRRTTGQINYGIEESGSPFVSNPGTFDMTSDRVLNNTTAPANWFVPFQEVVEGRRLGERDADADIGLSRKLTGMTYFNYFRSIEVSNCNGPIYFRGFHIDGKYGTSVSKPFGNVYVNNSNDVIFENCSVARSKNIGAYILNSEVSFRRGFMAIANFTTSGGTGYQSGTNRVSGNVAGLKLENSIANFGVAELVVSGGLPCDCPYVFANNDIGIELINSKITTDYCRRGFNKHGVAVAADAIDKFILVTQAYKNNVAGVKSSNSIIDMDGRLSLFDNNDGLVATNSDIKLAEISCDYNHGVGITLSDSTLVYNKNKEALVLDANSKGWRSQVNIEDNKQNIVLNRSTITYPVESGMSSKSGTFRLFRNHGRANNVPMPSVLVENGSVLRGANMQSASYGYLHSGGDAYNDTSAGMFFASGGAVRGAAFYVDNGSEIELHGTDAVRTNIVGPALVSKQSKTAAIYAVNGSKVGIAGPTTIAQFGVDILVDNNSTLEITPHNVNGILDNNVFVQSAGANNSDIELHATRSCIVANNNSNVIMKDLGDYHKWWNSGSPFVTSANYNRGDYLGLSGSTSAASMRFYANTAVVSSFDVSADIYSPAVNSLTYSTNKTLHNNTWGTANSTTNYAKYAKGGVCVQALNGSNVLAKNVHFKAGHVNASAAILDGDSSSECGEVYAWSISPDSTLEASYCTVSSVYPSGAAYHGPPALFASACVSALSGAPSGTPDTSSISILDSFGLNANIAAYPYGYATPQNRGPFRIFFTPADPVKFVGYASGTTGIGPTSSNTTYTGTIQGVLYSEPYQLIAQGYNPPIDLSSSYTGDAVLSALYVREFSGMTGSKGVFFYTKDYLSPTYKDKILLDDSALNTFANAKNALVPKSNRLKLVSYIRNTIESIGEGGAPPNGTGLPSLVDFDIEKDS